MDCCFMDNLSNYGNEELQEIINKATELMNTRRALEKKKAFDNFMDALRVMARDYPDELFDIEDSGGEYFTLDWEDLYKNFLEW